MNESCKEYAKVSFGNFKNTKKNNAEREREMQSCCNGFFQCPIDTHTATSNFLILGVIRCIQFQTPIFVLLDTLSTTHTFQHAKWHTFGKHKNLIATFQWNTVAISFVVHTLCERSFPFHCFNFSVKQKQSDAACGCVLCASVWSERRSEPA